MFKNIIGTHKPDILDCISNLSSDEVFTPPSVVNQVLDLFPQEVWANSKLKFLEPACKSGVFLREIAKRLMVGLEQEMPDKNARRQHIFGNMLYGISITELTGYLTRRSLYYSKAADSDFSVIRFDSEQGNIHYSKGKHCYVRGKCIHCGSPEGLLDRGEQLENYAYQFIHRQEVFPMKFDVIVGNPPYQLQDAGESTGASPIYQHFINQAKALNPKYISMIIPSRWFAGGKGLDEFRDQMLNDKRLSHLVDFHNAADCFPGVEIKGGVCYFLWDSKYSGTCNVTPVLNGKRLECSDRFLNSYDILVRFNKAIPILEKVLKKNERMYSERMSSRKPFGFGTNFTDFKLEKFKGAVEIYANKKVGWLSKDKVLVNQHLIEKYKVFLSGAYNGGDAYPHQIINRPIVASNNSCCTETYFVCDYFDNVEEAKNLEAYIRTRFFRFLVWLRKISQHNPKERFSFVPMLDMTMHWTDAKLYKRYDISSDEIKFIEEMVREIV